MDLNRFKPIAARIWQDKKLLALAGGGLFLALFLIVGVSTIFDRGIKVVSMTPSGEISIKSNLDFVFSSDVIEEREVGTTTIEELVKFTPAVPGRFRRISQRELRFLPETPFQPSRIIPPKSSRQWLRSKRNIWRGVRLSISLLSVSK